MSDIELFTQFITEQEAKRIPIEKNNPREIGLDHSKKYGWNHSEVSRQAKVMAEHPKYGARARKIIGIGNAKQVKDHLNKMSAARLANTMDKLYAHFSNDERKEMFEPKDGEIEVNKYIGDISHRIVTGPNKPGPLSRRSMDASSKPGKYEKKAEAKFEKDQINSNRALIKAHQNKKEITSNIYRDDLADTIKLTKQKEGERSIFQKLTGSGKRTDLRRKLGQIIKAARYHRVKADNAISVLNKYDEVLRRKHEEGNKNRNRGFKR